MHNPKTLLRVSVIGTVLVALCCFTPILVILLGTVGLAALTGYLDYVLLPALAFFIGLTCYAVWRKKKHDACCDSPSTKEQRL
ncbi:mercury resistance system transport protein MerF [Marinobacter sp. M3C]|jgi:mercuric ion transport protein|uniref:mercury resistance system transport protein MerF n=1 Tax=unclassified Marinobacter TaxID=83889 RepID=UPI00200BB012|nr:MULTISPECIES: mercury resistance system transport protein MerF [unclassified Marinobacter]MCL1478646.1 mercury resistance system transport protein MerF [Marinobacter sp.]MCL1482072.1 mercury resistance system transport protein MerF [Marinobacter sp.]MCL1484558.1 mercury resistance system transport protein MerF [Marinobacter sp.]MCL1487863.1 mercury resistance system transport protein MerF [Marinobacter sp.]UQG56248.1 mercury resistance system transport protein MerF [Marinobacter sp. M4C]